MLAGRPVRSGIWPVVVVVVGVLIDGDAAIPIREGTLTTPPDLTLSREEEEEVEMVGQVGSEREGTPLVSWAGCVPLLYTHTTGAKIVMVVTKVKAFCTHYRVLHMVQHHHISTTNT